MKFIIDRDAMVSMLAKTSGIVTDRSHLPVLRCAKLSCRDGGLEISATNLESSIVLQGECEVEAHGEVCAPAKKLFEIVRACPAGGLNAELNPETLRLSITSGDAQFRLSCLPIDDFPTVATEPDEGVVPVDIESFCGAIDDVAFTASSDETRFSLHAICLSEIDHGLQMTATDGHRLTRRTLPDRLRFPEGMEKALLPKAAAIALGKLCGPATKYALSHKLLFAIDDRMVVAFRLLEGEYPDASRVIPVECSATATINRAAFIAALERVALFVSQQRPGVTVSLEGNRMSLASSHSDIGDVQDVVGIEYDGEPISIIMNAAYLLEMLKHLGGDSALMEFAPNAGDGAPIVFKTEPEAHPGGYFGLVMPMRK